MGTLGRFCIAVLLGLAALPAQTADKPPLAGFRYIRVQPPEYAGGVDPFALAPHLEKLLAKQGWSILRGSEDLFRPEARQMASQALRCSIGIDSAGLGSTAHLRCADIMGNELVAIPGKGIALSRRGELVNALGVVSRRLRALRPRFDPRQTVDILARMPPVDKHPVSERTLLEMSKAGRLAAPVEGLWAATDESGYRLGIVAVEAGREFVIVTFESPRTYMWQPGMVKGRLSAAEGETFAASWKMGDHRESRGVATLNAGTLTFALKRDGRDEAVTLIKLRPIPAAPASDARNPAPTLLGGGTGFFCAPGIVATNHHVIAGAKRIELHLPLQERSVTLQHILSDVANDVSLLRVVDVAQSEMPSPVTLGDSGDVKLGTEAFVIGFPLGDRLGAGHKVTSGLISGLDGLDGDPRMLQVSAAIQPGSSGSPVFDRNGRVIGVVTATLETSEVVRAGGEVPQNVNFALKSDYLSLLVRRVSPESRTRSGGRPMPVQLTDLLEKVRASVGQIRTYR